MEFKITVEENPSPAYLDVIERALVEHNEARSEPRNYTPLALFLRNAEEEIVGGLRGVTVWGWLFVSQLWVAVKQASLGTELRANRQEEVSKRIEANLPSGVLAIHRNKSLQSAPHAQSALRRVKDFYEMNSLPVPENIAGILNNLPSERR